MAVKTPNGHVRVEERTKGRRIWIVEYTLPGQSRTTKVLGQACDDFAKPEARAAVIRAVHLHDRFVAGTLTPAQVAELAVGAADRLHPSWPESVEDADEVGRLLGVARQLFELRDHAVAVAVATNGDDVPRLVTVDAELREVLRSQTLMVLEFGHEPFEQLRDLQPAEVLALATTFRDAFAILDVIGCFRRRRPARSRWRSRRAISRSWSTGASISSNRSSSNSMAGKA